MKPNIELPPAPSAAGSYQLAKRHKDLVFLSGHGPIEDGPHGLDQLVTRGPLEAGEEVHGQVVLCGQDRALCGVCLGGRPGDGLKYLVGVRGRELAGVIGSHQLVTGCLVRQLRFPQRIEHGRHLGQRRRWLDAEVTDRELALTQCRPPKHRRPEAGFQQWDRPRAVHRSCSVWDRPRHGGPGAVRVRLGSVRRPRRPLR